MDCGDANGIAGVEEMKKIRELTAIHYRRVKRSASWNVQNVEVQLHCPTCGAALSGKLVKNSAKKEGVTPAHSCSLADKNGTGKN